MEDAEHSHYVAQLKAEFDSCDTTTTGFLDRDELTALCRKLQLDAHLPLLLDTLLGERTYGRVNFEEFKNGFVAVLSRSLDFSTSEDDSSYLQPVIPDEVKLNRRRHSHADVSCHSPPSTTDSSLVDVHKAELRRSTSLESVESLKSDEEAGSQKDRVQPDFQSKAAQQEEEEGKQGVIREGDHVVLQQLSTEEMDLLLRKLDTDLDDKVSISNFQKVLCDSAPNSCSTPVRPTDVPRTPHRPVQEERSARHTLPSLLTATVGQTVLSQLDDGSGCTSPEQVAALWTEEGIRNSWDILQILDFPLEERLSLADLTLALDNELLVSGNGIHQAALISYKNEIHHLQLVAEQACRERDKLKVDLDLADQRNLQLVREVDDRHASMETLNQTRIRDLEQDFRERLTVLRSQTEQESEVLLQQAEREHSTLQAELQLLHTQEAELQEELCSATQENWRLEAELTSLRLQLRDAQSSVGRLKRELEELHHKFGSLEADGTTLSHEERFTEIVKEYELQCRELRDRNDELSSELELLKSQRSDRKFRQPGGGTADTELSWTEHESDCDDLDMKRSSSPLVKKKLQPADKTALGSLDSGPAISIQTELALEQLKQKHEEELQQLRIQLETQVNYYERSLELMRQSMEVERKDISQAFKLEISELEEQKAQAEQQVQQLKEMLDKLQSQIQHGGGGWSSEQERKVQRERAELEQNFAREIGNLVQRLSAEKDQLEAELKLKMDKEVMLVREECEQQLCQMKLQHAEVQHRLLHQLHLEHQRLQEQRGFWKKRLVQLEQEKLQREEVFHQLKEQLSQSESSVEELRRRCGQLEDDLSASGGRCCGLEARLEEACAQLEESIAFLESHEVLSKRLAAEKKAAEEELQEAQAREEQLLVQVTQLRQELGNVQAASDNVPQDRLTARDQTISALRSELETLSDTTRASAAELDSLKTDRARLIQDLKDQAMAVDKLQLQLDGLSDELDCRRSAEDGLQEALQQEKIRTSQLQSSLGEEQEEVCRLSQENRSYARLADQLSTQIVEMEDEISTLRDHLRDLSSQLNDTADLVLDLREQINSKTSEVDQLRTEVAGHTELLRQAESPSEKHCSDIQSMSVQLDEKDTQLDRVRQQVRQLQWDLQKSQNQLRSTEQDLQDAQNQMRTTEQDLQEAQNQMRTTERDFEEEKRKMKQQLMELEKLVLALEDVMDPNGPHRTQLEEVQSEKDALQERLSVLQQEVHTLEDNLAKKRRRLEETERDHEKSREEEERLHRENTKHREDILELSSRNLQLSSNNAELSASLCQEQESVRMLREHLATVSKQQEEEGAMVRQLQATALQQEREKLQQQVSWTQERQLMEAELGSCRDQLGRLSELEAKLSSTNLKLQWLEEDKVKLQREANERNHKVETLQQSLLAVESETELLRSQLHTSTREKHSHAQEVTDLKRKLQDAHSKVVELESCVRQLMRQKEELSRTLEEQEEQTSIMQNEETHRLRVQNQELQHKLAELELQGLEVQNLRGRLNEQEAARTQAEDQAARANATLSLVQVQHVRQLQELQEQVGSGNREQLLQEQVMEEQKRSQQLKEALRLQAEQSSSQISVRQEQYEKAVASLQQKVEELETKLKGARLVLQEKVQQLKEQLVKNATSSALLKDLYVENSQLMKALQVTEQRQKNAEKKNCLLDEKIGALNRLLREIVPMSLAT